MAAHLAPVLHPAEPRSFMSLQQDLIACRQRTQALARVLQDEDQVVQAMPDASPTKWHLAHVTWFFEKFLLEPHLAGYERFDDRFHYCFNSYYVSAGARHPRPQRGALTRPSGQDVRTYRAHIDEALERLLATHDDELPGPLAQTIELGINHEQQHQELILTDILALFAMNPLRPAYDPDYTAHRIAPQGGHSATTEQRPNWVRHAGGIRQVGHYGNGFHYDNEGPGHSYLLQPFRLARGLVTNADWLAFMEDGGYADPLLWLSDGWAAVTERDWEAPGYWERHDGAWHQLTLAGREPIDPDQPVTNVSYFEADAFARWAGKRLPTEFEWEVCARDRMDEFDHLFGPVWQWTQSAYGAYPGYRAPPGAIGEYNGKFMCNQFVLRGASHATAPGHSRVTYRNFFYPDARWQFTGLRLAEDG